MALTADPKGATGGGGGNRTRYEFSVPTVQPTLLPYTKENNTKTEVRKDSRQPLEGRPLFIKLGMVSQANGSSFIETGNTKVICSLYGPRPIVRAGGSDTTGQGAPGSHSSFGTLSRGHGSSSSSGTGTINDFTDQAIITCDYRLASFAGSPSGEEIERNTAMTISQILERTVIKDLYPKCTIDINIIVLQDDGSAESVAITAASLALAHAGIQMFDLIPSCSVFVPKDSGTLSLDPTKAEETDLEARVQVSYLPVTKEIASLSQEGALSPQMTIDIVQLAVQACLQRHEQMKQSLISWIKEQKS